VIWVIHILWMFEKVVGPLQPVDSLCYINRCLYNVLLFLGLFFLYSFVQVAGFGHCNDALLHQERHTQGSVQKYSKDIKVFPDLCVSWGKTLSTIREENKRKSHLTNCIVYFVFQVGHCAIGMCSFCPFFVQISIHLSPIHCLHGSWFLHFYFFCPWLCCRNCEDFCDCNWGSSVFTDFHGLVCHKRHQTGEYYAKSRLKNGTIFRLNS